MESTLDLDLRLGSVLGAHPQAPAALALLLDRDPHGDDLFEPPRALGDDVRVQLLCLFGRLGRRGSALLLQRAYSTADPLFSTRFADVAVSASLRESALDTEIAVALIDRGLDVQAAVILRHLWELNLRALVVAVDQLAAAEWERATLAVLEGATSSRKLERLRERAWSRGLNVSDLIRQAARIEAGVEADADSGFADVNLMESIDERGKHMRAVYFGFLSDLAHGGSQMLLKSTMRSDESEGATDPLSAVGHPTDWSADLLGHTLWLHERFWRSFLPSAAPFDRPDLTPEERALFLAATALETIVRCDYESLMWDGADWTETPLA